MTNSVREQRPRTVCVGEAMVEFVRGGDGRFGMGCSGDTFNVAVYLARAGIDTAFATALGDDAYSDAILALATAEGVAGDLVLRARGRLPGLAVVDTDAAGARRRYDWRGEVAGARPVRAAGLGTGGRRPDQGEASSTFPASRSRSIPTTDSAASSPSSRWPGSRA